MGGATTGCRRTVLRSSLAQQLRQLGDIRRDPSRFVVGVSLSRYNASNQIGERRMAKIRVRLKAHRNIYIHNDIGNVAFYFKNRVDQRIAKGDCDGADSRSLLA
jgi:hypothetical protein